MLHATTRNNYAFPDDDAALALAGAVRRKRKEATKRRYTLIIKITPRGGSFFSRNASRPSANSGTNGLGTDFSLPSIGRGPVAEKNYHGGPEGGRNARRPRSTHASCTCRRVRPHRGCESHSRAYSLVVARVTGSRLSRRPLRGVARERRDKGNLRNRPDLHEESPDRRFGPRERRLVQRRGKRPKNTRGKMTGRRWPCRKRSCRHHQRKHTEIERTRLEQASEVGRGEGGSEAESSERGILARTLADLEDTRGTRSTRSTHRFGFALPADRSARATRAAFPGTIGWCVAHYALARGKTRCAFFRTRAPRPALVKRTVRQLRRTAFTHATTPCGTQAHALQQTHVRRYYPRPMYRFR